MNNSQQHFNKIILNNAFLEKKLCKDNFYNWSLTHLDLRTNDDNDTNDLNDGGHSGQLSTVVNTYPKLALTNVVSSCSFSPLAPSCLSCLS